MPPNGTKVPRPSLPAPQEFPHLANLLHWFHTSWPGHSACRVQVVCFPSVPHRRLHRFCGSSIAFFRPDSPQPLPALPTLQAFQAICRLRILCGCSLRPPRFKTLLLAEIDQLQLPVQFLDLSLQAGITAGQVPEIGNVDDPRGHIRSQQVRHREPPAASSDSSACVSSTCRRTISSRYRDQHTSVPKHMNASQLTSSTCSMRGSIEPPPPTTGWGC